MNILSNLIHGARMGLGSMLARTRVDTIIEATMVTVMAFAIGVAMTLCGIDTPWVFIPLWTIEFILVIDLVLVVLDETFIARERRKFTSIR